MVRHRTCTTLILLAVLLLVACSPHIAFEPTPVPTSTALPPDTATPTSTWTPSPTLTPSATPTSLPTGTPGALSPERYRTSGDHVGWIGVSGVERSFLVHVPPSYEHGRPTPLVLNLHGYSGTAQQQQTLSHMNGKADQEGFIAVHPQAAQAPPTWVGPLRGAVGQADVAFFRGMVTYLQRVLSIDPDRIYVTGMSNGATMTNHLGCVMSDVFAAIAPVAGGHTAHGLCEAERPVPVLVFHGTEDQVIPYAGDDSGTPAVHDWVEAWAMRNGCDSTPTVAGLNPDVQLETWGNCDENATVQLYTIEGGRHDWPGSGFGPGPWPEGMSPTIYATDVIWEFFQAHPKPPRAQAGTATGPSATAAATTERYQQPGDYLDYLIINGVPRLFAVHLPPSYQPDQRLPLVINLHAYSRTMLEQEKVSGMNAKADQEGFVTVHPQALNDPPSWWGPLPGEQGQPDRDFFRALLPYLQRRLAIDPARIYATGLSNGGTMTHRLGCDMAHTFAAIAPVAGGHTAFDQCAIDQPLSVLVIHGTDDQVIPYNGEARKSPPVRVWVEAWAERNGCDPAPTVNSMDEPVTQELWQNCDQGVEVVFYTLEGGGHTWPGSFTGMTSGTSFPYINATDLIWEFFESHPKPAQSLGHSY